MKIKKKMKNETLFTEETIRSLEDLEISMYVAENALKNFGEAVKETNQKRFLRHAKIEQKGDDLGVQVCEFLFEEGLICNGCELNRNNCEGSNCGVQMDYFFGYKTKDEIAKFAFKAIGDKYYNSSIRIKNKIKNGY